MKGFLVIVLFSLAACAFAKRCPTQQNDDWTIELLLPHRDCTKFYKCTHGKRVEQSCPNGLRYHIKNQQCDYPRNVRCGNRYVPEALKSPIVVHKPVNKPGSGGNRPVPPGPPRPEEEVDRPIDVPRWETEEEDVVEIEGSDEVVVDIVSEEAVEENESSIEEIVFLPNGCPKDFSVHWLVPDKKDCTKFFSCNYGEKIKQQCGATLHFNAELQVCDYPDRAGCV